MTISTAYAPPFKLIAPFFIIAACTFVLSIALLFGFDMSSLHSLNPSIISWVHIFLLGFVMMVILGAMAQLVPVVLEVGHFAVELYYAIYPLLFIGTILMALGLYGYPLLLPFGGVLVLVSFSIFLLETFLTILKVEKLNFIITTVMIANIFLLFGLIVGIVMALGYSGMVAVDMNAMLFAHIYLVLAGYVGVTIMGISLVLIPMFWLSHDFTWFYIKTALTILSIGILIVCVCNFINSEKFIVIGYGLTILALFFYFYQIYIIYKTRVRLEKDIYFKSVVFSYICLFIALICGVIYMFVPNQALLLTLSWLIFAGFITFLITGHLYKIVPFLVWYERFSPFVGKRKVPMLADLVPKKSSNCQFLFSAFGVTIIAIGILSGVNIIFKGGVCILFVGSIFLFYDVLFMIRFKEKENV